MKRIDITPDDLAGNPWKALSSLLDLADCQDEISFMLACMKAEAPVMVRFHNREQAQDCLEPVLDALESISQKSSTIYVQWNPQEL